MLLQIYLKIRQIFHHDHCILLLRLWSNPYLKLLILILRQLPLCCKKHQYRNHIYLPDYEFFYIFICSKLNLALYHKYSSLSVLRYYCTKSDLCQQNQPVFDISLVVPVIPIFSVLLYIFLTQIITILYIFHNNFS